MYAKLTSLTHSLAGLTLTCLLLGILSSPATCLANDKARARSAPTAERTPEAPAAKEMVPVLQFGTLSRPGATGWYTSDVTVNLAATTAAPNARVKSITYCGTGANPIPPRTINGDFATFTVTAEGVTTISSQALKEDGSVGNTGTFVVSVDKTPPDVYVTIDRKRALKRAGAIVRTEEGPFIQIVAEDSGSGVASIEYELTGATRHRSQRSESNRIAVDLDGSGRTDITYVATDKAGNVSTPATCTVLAGKTAFREAAIAFSPVSPAANALGWHNSDVSFTFTASDPGTAAPIAAIGSAIVVSGEGRDRGVSIRFDSSDGCLASSITPLVNIDRTPPNTTAVRNGETVELSSTDSLSGPSEVHYHFDEGPGPYLMQGGPCKRLTYTVQIPAGARRITYWCVDRAGNKEAPRVLDL